MPANLKEQLEKARNINSIKQIAALCSRDADAFDQLVSYMGHKDTHMAAMAAWSMGHAVQLQPAILTTAHHRAFLSIAAVTQHSGLKRNIARAWQWAPPEGELLYEMTDIAIRFLSDTGEDVAVKAFSITLLQNALRHIPELREEAMFIIEKNMPHATPAFTSRARKFIAFAHGIRLQD